MTYYILILIGISIIIFTKFFMKDHSKQSSYSEFLKEVEQTVEHFSIELEDENSKLMNQIIKMKQSTHAENQQLTKRVEHLEKQLLEMKNLKEEELKDTKSDQKIVEKKNEVLNINQRYDELMRLYQGGKSIQYISNKTGINIGEVQLIINLAMQEEKSRARA
ncbi:DUF6115 domain-containing protein [Chengkuizengella axinellae]|uniref:DUF2802 domain-containing protein n=1 Tax=Chengkuizengella axinellae TaxID=3064388 RepID=A0ABT9IWJ6_9BACL|nr:hypothetical protein [Chengkuizengella sp. 2205SS18-9]MDP5273467.1 hypothetical protein [Chengkuizengella sp. 2205SS18-9]